MRRLAGVAASPSITGIIMSIRITANRLRRKASRPCSPILHQDHIGTDRVQQEFSDTAIGGAVVHDQRTIHVHAGIAFGFGNDWLLFGVRERQRACWS